MRPSRSKRLITSYLPDLGDTAPLTATEELELLEDWDYDTKSKNKAIQDKLIKHNLQFAILRASGYSHGHAPMSELVGAATLGLTKAARRFKPDVGVRFISYATWWITNECMQIIKKESVIASSQAHKWDRTKQAQDIERKLSQKLGRWPTPHELEDALPADWSNQEKRYHTQQDNRFVSLDTPVDERGQTMGELMGEEDHHDDHLAIKSVRKALKGLHPRTRHIVIAYLDPEVKLQTIGNIYGITRERVRQVKEDGYKALRRNLKDVS